MNKLIESVRENEGFEAKPYIDILVKKDPEKYGIPEDEFHIIEKHLDKLKLTFGYGFTYIEEDEAAAVAEFKLNKLVKAFEKREPFINKLPLQKQEVIIEMSFQMGIDGVLKFKNMWKALKEFDYLRASEEMMDSRWAKQTSARAKRLSLLMKE